MRWQVQVRNFKCLASVDLELRNLNILCGRNGAGKSSLTQALLLHRAATQAFKAGMKEVALNGPAGLNLGTVADILYRGAATAGNSQKIAISINDGEDSLSFSFDSKDYEEEANALQLSRGGKTVRLPQSPWEFVFLSAERTGPRVAQERLSNLPPTELEIGEFGEYTAEVLQRYERQRIREAVLHADERAKPRREQNRTLLRNLELWLSSIFGPLQVRVDTNGAYAPPTILVRSANSSDDWVLTTNFGFGVTYCLPIILAGLLLPDRGVLIVDGPEAHLHPAAQTAIARFLAAVASASCVVLVETHSDHIVDGVRLAVSDRDSRLAPEDCVFLNFHRALADSVEIAPISIDRGGSLSAWPQGFFDQQSLNLRALAARKTR